MARQQAQDLQRTTSYVESMLTADPKKEKDKPQAPAVRSSPIKDLKARFSEPPAPPPQQPLPEKPDIARSLEGIIQPFLRRSDTERPKLTSSLSSPNRGVAGAGDGTQVQITTLMEALSAAKKDIEMQNARLKEYEEMLAQERTARESAEERAERLEKERKDPFEVDHEMNGAPVPPGTNSSMDTLDAAKSEDDPTSELQQRLDRVLIEMNEMKSQMERYRTRAEKAEDDSARDRKSLAEMIEKVRRDEEKRAAREEKSRGRRSRSTSAPDDISVSGTTVDGSSDSEFMELTEKTLQKPLINDVSVLLEKAGLQNGRPVTPEQYKQLQDAVTHALATRQRRGDQLAQAAPYATILGVVFAGVALMSYLNGWQKLER